MAMLAQHSRTVSSRGTSTSGRNSACSSVTTSTRHEHSDLSRRSAAIGSGSSLTDLACLSHSSLAWRLQRMNATCTARIRGVVGTAAMARDRGNWARQQRMGGLGNRGGDDSWRVAYDEPEVNDDYLSLTADEISDRLQEAAGMISIIHDIRPLHPRAFNASLEVWKLVRRVPPWERHRLLQDLEPGAIRALWKASMARYILDDERAYDLAKDYTIWQDFPEVPGQVYSYMGMCEQYVIAEPQIRFFTEEAERKKAAGEAPWLKPGQSVMPIQSRRFKMLFFLQPSSGELYARVVLPWFGPLDRWWLPCYLKLKMELALTPLKVDAGADMTFEYPHPDSEDLNGWISETMLQPEQLPLTDWPAPELGDACGSPFGSSPRDYVRVAAPGLYVGCAYRGPETGLYSEDECIYFAIARRMTREEYIQQMDAAAGRLGQGEEEASGSEDAA